MDARSDTLQYRGMVYWNPLAPQRMESLLDLLPLRPDDTVLEIGCGRAELAIRLIERFAVRVRALDRSPHAIELARQNAAARVPEEAIEFIVAALSEYQVEDASLDAIACIGGPRAADSLAASWRMLLSWVRPGGHLLLGEGFWSRPPEPAYLEATQIPANEMQSHWENIALARQLGATVLYTAVASRAEWDDFEGRVMSNVERYAAEHAGDIEVQTMLARRRAFYDAQMRWGREHMGFGLYLLSKPGG